MTHTWKLTSFALLISALLVASSPALAATSRATSTANNAQAQEEPIDERWVLANYTSYDAQGNVKQLSICDEHGNAVRQEYFDAEGNLISTIENEYTYFDDGRIQYMVTMANGRATVHAYEWDSSGQVAHITSTGDDGGTSYSLWVYDDQGRQTDSLSDTSEHRWTYEGDQTTYSYFLTIGDRRIYTITVYDEYGRIIEEAIYETRDHKPYTEDDLTSYSVSEYDKGGLDYAVRHFDPTGEPTGWSEYAFDDDGHSYTVTDYGSTGAIKGTTRYEYQLVE